MPEPHVDIQAVHDFLRANSRNEMIKLELKGRWLEEHRNKTSRDYYDFIVAHNDVFESLYGSLKNSFNISFERGRAEEGPKSDSNWVDYHKLSLKEQDLFSDRTAEIAYRNLVDCFNDNALVLNG
jgi:hypothetical protein